MIFNITMRIKVVGKSFRAIAPTYISYKNTTWIANDPFRASDNRTSFNIIYK